MKERAVQYLVLWVGLFVGMGIYAWFSPDLNAIETVERSFFQGAALFIAWLTIRPVEGDV